MQFIDQKELLKILPLSRSTLWRMRRCGQFPRAVQLTRGRIGYVREEVDAWMKSRTESERSAS